MKKSGERWRIWIDTGGTFTDCMAYDQTGKPHRMKVLSNSALRGKILNRAGNKSFKIEERWDIKKDIFRGYQFKLLHKAHEKAVIAKIDFQEGWIYLQDELNIPDIKGEDFEITAGEEAPILAARMVTGTSLTTKFPPLEMRLGTTRGTNTLLEHKGARVAFLVTGGFKDILKIGTQQRPDIFAINIDTPVPVYAEVIEVKERISAQGEIIEPLEEEETGRVIAKLRHYNIDTVAICLLHSYRQNEHELKLKAALIEAGITYISCSCELAPVIGFLSRAQTAVINAYLSPVIAVYLSAVDEKLDQGSLQVMTSAGGMVSKSFFTPKDSLLSGPAGGVVGAVRLAELSGVTKIITFDMGGTSTDVSRYDGDFDYQYSLKIGAATLISPALSIETVAAGGGSICSFDRMKFTVGPESAGATPGPACYGAGGPLTVTDVNLLLGRLDPENFGIPVHKVLSENALDKIVAGHNSGSVFSKEEVLAGFLAIANEKMADTIRRISIAKGYNPSKYSLLAFGGAGGQHACQVAELLSIPEIIIPYDAGLLSAYGMGHARVERFAVKQILQPLKVITEELEEIRNALAEEAFNALKQEGFSRKSLEVRLQVYNLRFAGQDVSLEIEYKAGQDITADFKEKYEALYGHWIEGRTIELESVKVVASVKRQREKKIAVVTEQYQPAAEREIHSYIKNSWKKISVYRWETLKPGAMIHGPALVINQYSTTMVDSHWTFALDQHTNAFLKYYSPVEKIKNNSQPEAVQLELFTNRFKSIAEGMGALLQRTAFSVNVKERLDFSCAVLDAKGELVANAPHIPVHLGSLGMCVRSILQELPLENGDVVITNHPAFGGSHLPDITLVRPVFTDENELAGFVANRAHHAEIGGKKPGSMPPDARHLSEEGVVIPPDYLIKNGISRWEEIKQRLSSGPFPSRSPEENLADLNAALASLNFGEKALSKLCKIHGLGKVHHYMNELKSYACASLQESLEHLSQGTFAASEQLDDGTVLRVHIGLDQGKLSIDFTGSDRVHPGNFNATPAIVNSVTIYVLRLLIGAFSSKNASQKELPLNEGIMQPVKITIPEGILNPVFFDDPEKCPAVVGGNTETSQRLVDTLLKAFDLVACSQGTMNNLLFGNENFGYYETIGGGTGAGKSFHGASAVHQHMTNTRITDPEIFEFRYPVRLDKFAIRQNSGGKGKFCGGDGIVREITFLDTVELTLLSQHRKIAPYGLHGGEEGRVGEQYIIRANEVKEPLEGVDQKLMQPGDKVIIQTPGGGGYGLKIANYKL